MIRLSNQARRVNIRFLILLLSRVRRVNFVRAETFLILFLSPLKVRHVNYVIPLFIGLGLTISDGTASSVLSY